MSVDNLAAIYDTLVKQISENNKNPSKEDLDFILNNYPKLDEVGRGLFVSLIRYHEYKTDNGDITKVPYKGWKGENNTIAFDLANIPVKLQKIILLFTQLHLQHLEQEALRKQ